MSDNEDLLGDDLGDQSLADYNLGNEEEEQLLADDYENAAPQNVPASIGPGYREAIDMVPPDYPSHAMEYNQQPMAYQAVADTECVVPNITVEVPNTPLPELPTYAPYEPPVYEEHAVPPAIPAAPVESPQIVPSDINPLTSNGDLGGPRERFVSERPPGAQRLPQVRDIPDSLDKVVIPRGGFPPRGRTSWRSAQFAARYTHAHAHAHAHAHQHSHPYRRNNMHRPNFMHRPSFPPPQMRPSPPQMRPDPRPEMRPDPRPEMRPDPRPEMRPDPRPEMRPDPRPEMRPDPRPEIRPDLRHEMRLDPRPEMRPEMRSEPRPEIRPDMRLEPPNMPQMGPEISPERPILPQEMPMYRPPAERQQFFPRFQYRPNMNERPQFGPVRHNFEPRPMYFSPRLFPPPMREIVPNAGHIPQVTIRQALPASGPSLEKNESREPEVRMLPVPLPANLPPGGLAGKKVLINPHFKGNFQPPVEGLPAYIPTRIQKSPPLSPTIENKFGPVKDIDDAAERFIAEQRNALARAAVRKYPRRSPQRYIENTTIEIENDLAHGGPHRRRSNDDDDLLRRQEEFINANRAGLRRRMRSPSPPRRSLSPRRSPERRARPDAPRHSDEDSEYKRRLREQESLRERVLRAKEVRRRKNAVALHKQLQDKERENQEKEKEVISKPEPPQPIPEKTTNLELQDDKPDTTRQSPEKIEKVDKEKIAVKEKVIVSDRDRSPVKKDDSVEVNSTCENLTPPHNIPLKRESPERALTPPLPDKRTDSDDDLDLILGDIDGILSDDEDSGRFKEKPKKSEPLKSRPQVDLRSKLPPKSSSNESRKPQRQKIVFTEDEGKIKKKDKSPPRRAVVTSSTKTDDAEPVESKKLKVKSKLDMTVKSRQRIIYEQYKQQAEKEKEDEKKSTVPNRRVILQRKATPKEKSVFSRIEVKADPTKPNPGIFSRAVRTAIGTESTRIVIKKDEPQVQFESDSDIDEDSLLEDTGITATVVNLPHGMTDTRMKTLAGNEVQSLTLDKEERSAKITFKSTVAAENFKKKFNNKMVAASRLSVTLR